MISASKISEYMKVVGSDGGAVGFVDRVEGGRLKLSKNHELAGGEHHYLPLDVVEDVEEETVHLSCTSQEALDEWMREDELEEEDETLDESKPREDEED